ncbi:MAG: N-acetylmuramoyl-L-alanine amidase [Parvularculaceae bacterium]
MIFAVRHVAFLAAAGLCAAFLTASASAADLVGVRFGETSAAETRIVIDLSEPTAFMVSADGQTVQVDFTSAHNGVKSGPGAGHVASFTAKENKGAARVVFMLSKPAAVTNQFEIPAGPASKSHRLVLDLKDGRAAEVTGPKHAETVASAPQYEDITAILEAVTASTAVAVEVPTATASPAPAPIVAKPKLKVIVIDPGHGGADPGASSSGGVVEKTVTLAAARRLAELLEASGRYQIVMTRADDSRLQLEQRTKVARDAGADLFISLHADAIDDASVRGGSLYTLSKDGTERSAQEAETSGNFNNVYGVDIEDWSAGDPALNRILYDQATKKTATNSGRYANFLLKRLKGVTPLLNNSHRAADLKVLLSPDVPAVLFELAFISNDLDATNLSSKVWRTKTMTAVANSIDDYFRSSTEAATAPALAQGAPAGR